MFGAGTDANVFVTLTGEKGDSGERQLQDSNNMNKFERKAVSDAILSDVYIQVSNINSLFWYNGREWFIMITILWF